MFPDESKAELPEPITPELGVGRHVENASAPDAAIFEAKVWVELQEGNVETGFSSLNPPVITRPETKMFCEPSTAMDLPRASVPRYVA
jgi:hypothetical protein